MKIGDILYKIIVRSVQHVYNYMLRDDDPGIIVEALDRFIRAQGLEQLDAFIPGVSLVDVDQWAKNYAYSLYIDRCLLPEDADSFTILCTFKNTLPQVYDDLVLRGEVLGARLRTLAN